ncbi:sulfotransferase domain protein [Leptolyngbya sp. Heron Island J]|uniref:sulfotransferase family protein n=1 Tax=Leptolyngbya sp. Heron Island J TaxID=1385935 RepID=UPI0003B9D092|nr:sulfotransferase [Leptolyngbya sp. Heron Island J]ESA38548.1 sulfotransferase domain protein [Leptolyngbya sp. Heron Island J]
MHTQKASKNIDMRELAPCPKLFVVGCPRSGTSWVTSLIAAHPEVVAVPRETHVYRLVYEPFVDLPKWNWRRRLRSWKGILRRYGVKPLLFGFGPQDIWQGILRDHQILNRLDSHGLHGLVSYEVLKLLIKAIRSQVPETDRGLVQAEELIAAMFERFIEQYGQPGQSILEKTPMHIRYAEQILWRFPEARIIEVIRDGRDVCVSYNALAQQQRWAQIGTTGAIRQWKKCIEWGETIHERPGLRERIHRVRYEALKADPERSLQQIFSFAKLTWEDQQIKEIVKSADIGRIAKKGEGQYVRSGTVGEWKEKLSETELAMCHDIAGEQLARLGYIADN